MVVILSVSKQFGCRINNGKKTGQSELLGQLYHEQLQLAFKTNT